MTSIRKCPHGDMFQVAFPHGRNSKDFISPKLKASVIVLILQNSNLNKWPKTKSLSSSHLF